MRQLWRFCYVGPDAPTTLDSRGRTLRGRLFERLQQAVEVAAGGGHGRVVGARAASPIDSARSNCTQAPSRSPRSWSTRPRLLCRMATAPAWRRRYRLGRWVRSVKATRPPGHEPGGLAADRALGPQPLQSFPSRRCTCPLVGLSRGFGVSLSRPVPACLVWSWKIP